MAYDTEEKAYQLIKEHLISIDRPVIVEIGMFDGYHTNMLLKWAPRAVYHGFEADPRNVARINLNGVADRIHFNHAAVGSVNGPASFNLATEDSNGCAGSSSLSEFKPVLTETWPWLKKKETQRVWCWKLDTYCRRAGIDRLDFLWMDVQGAERMVFARATETLKNTSLVWTEYDACGFYADSSGKDEILTWFPGWTVLADCGGDILLKSPASR